MHNPGLLRKGHQNHILVDEDNVFVDEDGEDYIRIKIFG